MAKGVPSWARSMRRRSWKTAPCEMIRLREMARPRGMIHLRGALRPRGTRVQDTDRCLSKRPSNLLPLRYWFAYFLDPLSNTMKNGPPMMLITIAAEISLGATIVRPMVSASRNMNAPSKIVNGMSAL